MISIAFKSQFNSYDVARLNRTVFFAGEPFPASPLFANGQGPGLWRLPVGGGGAPTPVAGSEARRLYGLANFELSDGTQQLCAIGVRTADIYAHGNFPQVLSLWTPDPLIFFTSEDGETWDEHDLGAIEKGGGPYEQYLGGSEEGGLVYYPDNLQNAWMNDVGHWAPAPDREGTPCLWRSMGRHLLQWDGVNLSVRALDLGTVIIENSVPPREISDRASDLAIAHGRKYFARNRTQILGDAGTLVAYDASANLNRIAPRQSDGPLNFPTGGEPLDITFKNGAARAIAKYRGLWPLFFTVTEATPPALRQVLAGAVLPQPPDAPLTINCAALPSVAISDAAIQFDLGGNGSAAELFAVRCAAGRAYLIQPHDFQDAADATKALIAVPMMPCGLTIDDVYVTTGINPTWPDGEGEGPIIIGGDDGTIVIYDPNTGETTVIIIIDGPVLELAIACNNELFALSRSSVWWIPKWYEPNPVGAIVLSAGPGYHFTDFLVTSDQRLFVISNNGVDGRVQILAICQYDNDGEPITPTVTQTDDFPGVTTTTAVELPDGTVVIFGGGPGGTTEIDYGPNGEPPVITTIPQIPGNPTTTAVDCSDDLYLGTDQGELWRRDHLTRAWSLVAILADGNGVRYKIKSIVVINCILYITVEGGGGTWFDFDPTTDTLTPHLQPGGTDVDVIIPFDGGVIIGGPGGVDFDVPVAGHLVTQILEYDGAVTQVLVAPSATGEPLSEGCKIWVRAEPSPAAPDKSLGYVPAKGGVWRPIARRDSDAPARAFRVLVVPGATPLNGIAIQATGAGADE